MADDPGLAQGDGGKDLPYVPLPAGLLDPRHEAGAVFDGIAGIYDAARPGYPAEAIGDLAARCHLGPASTILEVGCGTGQATRDLARTGAAIHCLEPGPRLAELARQKLAATPNVRVLTTTFESAGDEPGHYDAVVSATAFHWIDPNASFTKAARMLRPGGSLALLTNAHCSAGSHAREPLASAIRDAHRQVAPEVGSWTFPSAKAMRQRAMAGGDIAAVWGRVERKLAEPPPVAVLFDLPAVSTYPWLASYDRRGYLAMLSSQSSYALMEPDRRNQLLSRIGALIDDQLNGTITKQYVTILATARRRSPRA